MAGQSVGAIYVDAVLNNKGFNRQVQGTVKGAESNFSSAFGRIGKAIGAALSVAAVTAFGKSCVDAAAQAESAFMGLNSILNAQGKSFSQANAFIKEYTADGLVGMTNAVQAYKNLASRGYSTEQIEKVMYALKDSAAFGRAAAYSYGDAITTATEGLRQENSILVDNAGVTKNVAKMWDEYAASIGKTSNQLTQQEKIQAEVNGILNETKFQLGDAARYADTFQGRMSKLTGTFTAIKTEIGNIIIPIANLFIPYLQKAADAVLRFVTRIKELLAIFGIKMKEIGGGGAAESISSGFDSAAESAGAAADAISGTGTAATKAAKAVKRALAPYDELNRLTFPSDSSSGSSGGGGGGGGSSPTTEFIEELGADDAVTSEVEKFAQKIEKYLAPLREISFDKLVASLGMLKDAALGLGKTIWVGLEWAYFNLLVPLAEWTIEDLLPAFFYALSGALHAVDGILQEVYPWLAALWENFLKPIASWTGGAIVSILNGIGDALYWVGDNANIVMAAASGIAGALAGIKGLKIAASVIDFVKYAGTLAGSSTVWGSIAAAFGQLWTYFKASKIWTAVAGAFKGIGAAAGSLASALGISVGALAAIVGVIAAVVAGSYLLITNWEEVSAWLEALPGKILDAWESVKEWFANLPKAIKGYFDDIVKKIESVDWYALGKNLGKKLGEGILKIGDWLNKTWDSISKWFSELPSKFESAWESAKQWIKDLPKNIIDTIKNAIDWFGEVKKWFSEVGKACVDGIKAGWEAVKTAVGDFVKGLIDGVKEGLGIASPSKVFADIGKWCIEGLLNGFSAMKASALKKWEEVKKWFADIKKTASVAVTQKWNSIKGKWSELTKNIKDKTASMKARIGTTWGNLRNAWSSITNNIKDKTASMKAKVGSTWSSLKGAWNSLMSNFKDKTVSVKVKLESMVSDMKSWINSNLISKINSSIPFVKIPKLAQGGWLPAGSPQLAVVGDNRREPEIVAPESKIRDQVKQAMQEIGFDGSATIRLEIAMPNGRTIIKEINRAQMAAGKVLLLT